VSEAVELAEVCAVHPERASVGTCERCGSFMCEGCRSAPGAGLCETCARRLGRGRWVAQVPILGVLMMVHGGLTVAMGLILLVYGVFTAAALGGLPANDDPAQQAMSSIMLGGMLGLGVIHMPSGVLQLLAGWRVRTYQSRGLGITSLWLGLLTFLGCYCLPTSLAMIVYGSIVLHSGEVVERFDAERPAAT